MSWTHLWLVIRHSNPLIGFLLTSWILPLGLATTWPVYAADSSESRFYVAIRAGAVVRSSQQVGSGFQTTLDGTDVLGLSIGMNFNKYLGAELAADHYEFVLNAASGDKAAEYNVAPYLALLRLRYPLLNDRLTPYLIGGGGVSLVQVDDKFPALGSTTLK